MADTLDGVIRIGRMLEGVIVVVGGGGVSSAAAASAIVSLEA